MIVVSDSTPLMHLPAMGRLELLRDLFGEIYVPDEVYEEVVSQGAGKPGAVEVQVATWIRRRAISNVGAVSHLRSFLGAGESASIVLAEEMGADLLILDDRSARAEAQGRGLRVTGTVGILLDADAQGKLDFQQALDDLLKTGFRLHPTQYQQVIHLWKARKSQSP